MKQDWLQTQSGFKWNEMTDSWGFYYIYSCVIEIIFNKTLINFNFIITLYKWNNWNFTKTLKIILRLSFKEQYKMFL